MRMIYLLCLFGMVSTLNADPATAPSQNKPLPAEPLPLHITPAPGTRVTAGDTLTLHIASDDRDQTLSVAITNLAASSASGWARLSGLTMAKLSGKAPLTVDLTIPKRMAGAATASIMEAVGLPSQRKTARPFDYEVFVMPDPDDPPKRITIKDTHILGDKGDFDFEIEPEQIEVTGYFENGEEIDLTTAQLGTTYTTADPGAVTVAENGVLIPHKPGATYLIADYQGRRDMIAVRIGELATRYYPPRELTSQLTLKLSPLLSVDGQFEQTLTITNNGKRPIVDVRYLVLDQLTPDIDVDDDDGTRKFRPYGTPFLSIGSFGDLLLLKPGESKQQRIVFHNPRQKPIRFVPRIFSGSHI